RKRMHVHVRDRGLHSGHDIEISIARVGGMDAALQTDFGGAGRACFDGAPRDLVDVEYVSRSAQILRATAFGKSAEAALVAADVRVIDVAVDHVGHGIAAYLTAQPVGRMQK